MILNLVEEGGPEDQLDMWNCDIDLAPDLGSPSAPSWHVCIPPHTFCQKTAGLPMNKAQQVTISLGTNPHIRVDEVT